MNRKVHHSSLLGLVFFLMFWGVAPGGAVQVADPARIEVTGLVSRGEDGAAWLKFDGRDILVTPGYMIGRDLRVTAVRNDSVILYRPAVRQYFAISPNLPLRPRKDRSDVIWSGALPLWKAVRMIALAYGKDYICHGTTSADAFPQSRARDMNSMLEHVVTPHHRFRGEDGVIFVAPVKIVGTGWQRFLKSTQNYDSRVLAKWFPALAAKGTLISDGKDISRAIEFIGRTTKVPMSWRGQRKAALFCSMKDRPWYEILEYILVFNGFGIVPTQQGLVIDGGAK
ncbi:hypothetical protein KBA41_08020 [Candidatus Ozemobacteraceae bacterium]|nr:hypothetical protein [Candidatus Ozemobacteraceae bacterium]